ncbi:MAG TPA: DNA polymerase III subunit alpha [Firmicutes bacterium]|nr:DNA polymerase III subunit alpha [Bacillota bacterium]
MIHLHNHTEYSLLDGASRIKDLVKKAGSFNMPALAITDHANLHGIIEFYKACKAANIKPIIGCEFYVAPGSRFEKAEERYHLVLLCKNKTGYKNLIQLVSRAYNEGFYYKPRIDWELLQENPEGLIAMSACLAGEIPKLIQAGKVEAAETRAREFKELFGHDYYLEIMDHGLQEEKIVNRELIRIAGKFNIPLVASNDTHYINQEDARLQDILLCIGTKDVLSNPNRFRFSNNQFYFKSPTEMENLFKSIPEALKNTEEIAEKCNLEFSFGQILLPKFPVEDSNAALRRKAFLSLPERISSRPDPAVMERLEYELKVINDMGFADYFLIVQDIVNWSKKNGIPVGPGRGSAAGSLVAYLLGITELNPLDYGLLFERFLNPSRVTMPDIDLDFDFRRRDEVVQYISERYGKDHVAQIITFGTMAARAAVRDVGRVMEEPLSEIDRLAKKINSLEGVTDKNLQHVIDAAREIEGMPRHTGVHAAGVIIGAEPLNNIIPTQISDGQATTQFEMNTCEEIGLLKMDILGLKTLTVIDDARKLIEKKGIIININKLPLDDKKVYRLLSQGHTAGVFQFESSGMQGILKKLKPNCFEDLIAAVALFRPGPLGSGMTDDFIDCKHGRKPIKYLHSILEPILKETYGVILYQEQVMRIATDMAGFTLAEADLMRRAIGKKKPEILAAQREKFITGSVNNGINKTVAEEVFTLIDYFSGYGFNKSHSACYAFISYQTAYLKAYYPLEFMAALLSNTANQDKIALFLNECRRLGIKVLPPDINKSEREFTLDENTIRFGLGAVKNLGEAAISQILNNRPYKDIYDLVYKAKLNKAILETLACAGCLSDFGSRKSIVQFLPTATKAVNMVGRNEVTLFGTGEDLLPDIPAIEEYSLEDLLKFEKDLLGFYISSHPLDAYKIPPCQEIANISEGKVKITGVVTTVKSGVKNGKLWCFATVEDHTGRLDVLLFGQEVKIGRVYLFQGKIKTEEEKFKLFAYQIKEIARKAA